MIKKIQNNFTKKVLFRNEGFLHGRLPKASIKKAYLGIPSLKSRRHYFDIVMVYKLINQLIPVSCRKFHTLRPSVTRSGADRKRDSQMTKKLDLPLVKNLGETFCRSTEDILPEQAIFISPIKLISPSIRHRQCGEWRAVFFAEGDINEFDIESCGIEFIVVSAQAFGYESVIDSRNTL